MCSLATECVLSLYYLGHDIGLGFEAEILGFRVQGARAEGLRRKKKRFEGLGTSGLGFRE